MLLTKDGEQPKCEGKKCGKEYIAAGAYVGYNLKRHLEFCRKKFEVPIGIPVSTGVDIGNALLIMHLIGWMSYKFYIDFFKTIWDIYMYIYIYIYKGSGFPIKSKMFILNINHERV